MNEAAMDMQQLFIADIGLNFRTSYYDRSRTLILDPGAVCRNYLTTWFPLDLVSSFPVQMMLLAPDLSNLLLEHQTSTE